MDNVTHSLVGAALARTGLDRTTPLATATLVLAANAPDVDMLAFVRGEWFALAFRRGITHGIPALAVLPLAVAGTIAAWDRGVRRRLAPDRPPARPTALLALAFVGVLTHPVLDWMNTYGTRWWVPIDGRWSYGDSLFIIDPWLWLALGAAVALGAARARALATRVAMSAAWAALAVAATLLVLGTPLAGGGAKTSWTIGIAVAITARALGLPSTAAGGMRLARALMGAAALYVTGMVCASRMATADVVRAVEAADVPGAEVVMVQPLPANPFASEVIIRAEDRYVRGEHRWVRSPRVALGVEPDLPLLSGDSAYAPAAVRLAQAHPDIAHYLVWSRFPYWQVEPAGEDVRVRVGDARYVARTGSLSGLTVTLPRPTATD